ncbi:MAG TPA: hypothetical protein V6C86_11175 [Oculatellaceae cyanobacterium]
MASDRRNTDKVYCLTKKRVLSTLLLGMSLTATAPNAYADNGGLLAWGHHKKDKDSQSDTSTSTPGSTGRGTGVTNGAIPPTAAQTPSPSSDNGNPILVTPSTMVDLNSARFSKLTIDLQNAQFHDTSIERGTVTASDMDFTQGALNGLNIDVIGGHFQQFVFDEMTLNTSGNLRFDPRVLLQEKVLQFTTPTRADVAVSVSQESLNKFLSDPHTLANLSVTVSKRLGALANLFGANVSNLGVTLKEAHVILNKGNKMLIAVTADLGMGGVGVPLSFEIDAQLGVKDGWVDVSDTHLMTNGQEISPQLSEVLVKKVNSLASWGHKSDDIQFDFTDIKVIPGKQFSVKGTAMIKRLRLTAPRDEGQPSSVPPTQGAPVAPGMSVPGAQVIPVMPMKPATPQVPGTPGQMAPGITPENTVPSR